MAYRFANEDASVEEGVRRIAAEQIEGAIDKAGSGGMDVHEVVHEVRKHTKKLRGLIRLVRPTFEGYSAENAALRDAANTLSFVRDSEALLETYDDLLEVYQEQVERRSFASVRRRLTLRQKEIERAHDLDARLRDFSGRMHDLQARSASWQLHQEGFEAIAGGLIKTYKRARQAMAAVEAGPSAEAFHEWRKRVKYHWYHTRLLTPVWPGPMKAHEKAADQLGDLLGDHHDLAVFRATLAADPEAFGRATDVEVLVALIDRRQAVLEARAFEHGAKLLADPPKTLTRRWGTWWEVWRKRAPADEVALA